MVSVIVPVYNGAQTLPACLQALQHQTQPPAEIIIVDDGSIDETVAVAASFAVRVLSQANAGPAAARNHGARMARGNILLFTDADCIPAPDWIEQMLVPFANPSVAGAKGVYRTRQRELAARFVQQEYQDRYDRMVGQSQIDFVDTYSAGYRRDIFLAEGGFDINFSTASVEDQEFSFRLSKQGYQLQYVPKAIVYHRHDRHSWDYARRKYWIGHWKALVIRRYPSKLIRDSHTPQILKMQMGLAALGGLLLGLGVLTGYKRLIGAGGMAWLLLWLTGLPFGLKIWRRDPLVLLVVPWLLWLRAWALALGFLAGNLYFLARKVSLGPHENHKL